MYISKLHLISLLASLLASHAVNAGTIRYELPSLLGEYQYTGQSSLLPNKIANVDTTLEASQVTSARLLIEGSITTGTARGDGIVFEETEFELLPNVFAFTSFQTTFFFQSEPTSETFIIEQFYNDPFRPDFPSMPNPEADNSSPVSFQVTVSISISSATDFPQPKESQPDFLVPWHSGIVVVEPITADIDSASIILEGPTIVPEPHNLFLCLGGLISFFVLRVPLPSSEN